MNHNTRPYQAKIVNNGINEVRIDTMDCPVSFFDGNSIKHAWNALGRRVTPRNMPPLTIPELQIALRGMW